jgi:hypothetical protein
MADNENENKKPEAGEAKPEGKKSMGEAAEAAKAEAAAKAKAENKKAAAEAGRAKAKAAKAEAAASAVKIAAPGETKVSPSNKTTRLKELYKSKAVPALMKEFQLRAPCRSRRSRRSS